MYIGGWWGVQIPGNAGEENLHTEDSKADVVSQFISHAC